VLLGGHAAEQHDELVAALAAHVAFRRVSAGRPCRLLDAQHPRETLRDDAQQLVADGVAERVVDALELVEVEEH